MSSPLAVPVGLCPRTAALPCSAALLVTPTTGPPESFVFSRRRRVGAGLGRFPALRGLPVSPRAHEART